MYCCRSSRCAFCVHSATTDFAAVHTVMQPLRARARVCEHSCNRDERARMVTAPCDKHNNGDRVVLIFIDCVSQGSGGFGCEFVSDALRCVCSFVRLYMPQKNICVSMCDVCAIWNGNVLFDVAGIFASGFLNLL